MTPLVKHLLLALALGLSAFGCSKKNTTDPVTPTPSNTGSYKLDGRLVNCTGQTTLYSPAGGNVDYLFVRLTTTPQPAAGAEALSVEFSKTTGQPVSAYRSTSIVLFRNQQQPVFFAQSNTPFSITSTGGYTGTFATTSVSLSTPVTITDGVYTDVHQ